MDAAAELIRRYEPAVRTFIRVRLTDSQLRRQMDSTDICQSVLAHFFTACALGRFDLSTPDQLIALLGTIARNSLINHSEKAHAAKRNLRRLECEDVNDRQLAGRDATPSQIAIGRELIEAVRTRLRNGERDLVDRRVAGQTWEEIASAVGGTPDAARMKHARAVDRIAKQLGLQLPES
jgi:RNA polymerase sigma-70 factor (ECF subfamily)